VTGWNEEDEPNATAPAGQPMNPAINNQPDHTNRTQAKKIDDLEDLLDDN